MRKANIFAISLLALAACSTSNSGKTEPSKGVIDCYAVRVYGESSSTSFSGQYSVQDTRVYEYKSEEGKYIYCEKDYSQLQVYADRYTSSYTVYNQTRLVGYLTRESNFYLDLDDRIIDCETKWTENKYEGYQAEGINNKEAYEKAKSGFIAYDGYFYTNDTVRLDMVDKALERHYYYKIGDGCNVQFKAKWF